MEETTNSSTQTGDEGVTSTEDTETGSDTSTTPNAVEETVKDAGDKPVDVLRDVINKDLNKDFKSDEDVVNSYKEATNKISEQGNEIKELKEKLGSTEQTTQDGDSQRMSELENRLNQSEFYKNNPEYDKKEIREVLGINPAETIKNESIKSVVDGKVASDKTEDSKSVLQSNPRMGQVTDKVTEAKEHTSNAQKALGTGDITTAVVEHGRAAEAVTNAVLDAYEDQS